MCANLDKNYTAEAIKMSNKNEFGSMLPQNCLVSDWSEWSNCTAGECGKKGLSFRTRTIYSEAKYGGLECPKELTEKRICYKKCNQFSNLNTSNCVVSKWSDWSECKKGKTCVEGGYQERYRKIIREPKNGNECPNLMETRKCYLGNLC